MTTRILVVDDDPSVRSMLGKVLSREGFEVLLASTGQEGLHLASQEQPDLVILDLNLPDQDGEEICAQIRSNPSSSSLPVLILTGKTAEGLPSRCLNGGADDYVSKPFDVNEILARLRALLRRTQSLSRARSEISHGHLSIRVEERMVLWKSRRLGAFAPKEFEMLRLLVLNAPKVLDKNAIATKVWGMPLAQLHHRTLDVHVRRIRKKLGPSAPCLKTVPAVGFQWLDESVTSPPETAALR